MIENLRCPKCGEQSMHKAGVAKSYKNRYQKYYCNKCYITTLKPIIVEVNELSTNGNNDLRV